MEYKRILTIQDISCIGQCSMTVALPILSACGHEVCILPAAVLSTHTGGFGRPAVKSLTDMMPDIVAHWKENDIDFDLIRREAAEKARANYREVSDKFEYGIPKLEYTWKDICSSRFEHLSWEERRNLYHNQPSMMIWRDAFKEDAWRYDIDKYQCSEEEYVKRAVLTAFLPICPRQGWRMVC